MDFTSHFSDATEAAKSASAAAQVGCTQNTFDSMFLVAVVQLFNRKASVRSFSVRSFSVRSSVRVSVRSDISASVRVRNLKFFMNVGFLRVSKIFFSFFKILSIWSDFGPKIPDFCAL